ncbi:DUF4215 domain-containing protein [Aestuariivirga litoralis]|nr:DUF4215 domain-containing protein [Aestuariivirga litoralis]
MRQNKFLGGAGAHLFLRDPSTYLLGAYGSAHTWDGINVYRAAVEAELYMGDVTLTGLGGLESYDYPTMSGGMIVLNQDNSHFFGQVDLNFYATDNLMLSAGFHYLDQVPLAALAAEYKIEDSNVSLFANALIGDSQINQANVGIRIYTGTAIMNSLRKTHRTRDPQNYVPVFHNLALAAPVPAGVCGDGALDAGEQCDDGNTVGGDGCASNCQTESCGNGVLDVGEQCDDGNTTSGDGCDFQCNTENIIN